MSKEDLVLNNLQWLICHKTQPNQIIILEPLHVQIISIYDHLHSCPTIPPQAVFDTRSIFKQAKAGMNSELFLSSTSYHTNVKEHMFSYLSPWH